MNVRTKFEVLSFTCSWDNRGYPQKLGSRWHYDSHYNQYSW